MSSYMCSVCNVEYDTVPKAMECFNRHGDEYCAQKAAEFVEGVPPFTLSVEAVYDDGTIESVDTMQQPPLPLAAELLGRAARHMHDRSSTYDKPDGERSMGRAVEAFNAITGHRLVESEGWLLLQVLKDVRLFTRSSYHEDSAEDCIAYAALKAEAKSKGL